MDGINHNSNGLSIIIPSMGRVELLKKLLLSIQEDAAILLFPTEIILVDDTPKPEKDKIEILAEEFKAILISGVSHVGGKRNLGALSAKYEYILFLDSDITIHKGTLKAHYNKLSLNRESNIAGCLGLVNFVGEKTFAWEVISEMQLTLPFYYPLVSETVPWGPTANISFKKDIFLLMNGFDTTLPKYGGEDVDLGLRLTRAGYTILTSKEAVADHTVETWNSWGQNFKRLFSFGLADYHLMIRHPERTFLDFPSAPLLWIMQIFTCIVLYFVKDVSFLFMLLCILLSIITYHLTYAIIKKRPESKFRIYLLGPVIFYIEDIAKCIESLKHKKVSFIFRRVKFIDDMISQDWQEIAASAWGVALSAIVFFGSLIFAFKCQL